MPDKDSTYLKHIMDCICDIELFVQNYSLDSFMSDKKTFNSCIRMFEIIGEASKKVSSDVKEQYPDVEWKKIAGLRDKLIHDYEGVDLKAVWLIIKNNIPILKTPIQKIIQTYN